ncbi:MAG: RNA polymerase sigma factor [Candidatus Sericytochromatia bacterium]
MQRSIEAVWRIESARLIASLARIVQDVGLAEDLAQDALLVALEKWPTTGIPHKPGAWLMATAKNRAIDLLRRNSVLQHKLEEYGRIWLPDEGPDLSEALERDIDDEMLSLIFTACHPILSVEARVALTLKIIGGLSTAEIARAYLVKESTMAQRIVRAKRSLSEARVPFETPSGADLSERLGAVLEVIYLIFNEGYAATSGADWMRPQLCQEALRLGRIMAGLMPQVSEVQGLLALMELQASRFPARNGPNGEPILLLEQNRARWDTLLIQRGLAALARAANCPEGLGPYALQAEIAACHARARQAADTDWGRIAAVYDALLQLMPSPVVALNRAVAVGMAYGPAAGLEEVDALSEHPALAHYPLLPSVRGDLLMKLGRMGEAAAAFTQAADMTENAPQRALLRERAQAALAQTER